MSTKSCACESSFLVLYFPPINPRPTASQKQPLSVMIPVLIFSCASGGTASCCESLEYWVRVAMWRPAHKRCWSTSIVEPLWRRSFPDIISLSKTRSHFPRVKDHPSTKMPLVFLEQLPLPTLKSYVVISVLLFVSTILYTLNATVGSGERDYSKIYDFVTQDNFCFWVRNCCVIEAPLFN